MDSHVAEVLRTFARAFIFADPSPRGTRSRGLMVVKLDPTFKEMNVTQSISFNKLAILTDENLSYFGFDHEESEAVRNAVRSYDESTHIPVLMLDPSTGSGFLEMMPCGLSKLKVGND